MIILSQNKSTTRLDNPILLKQEPNFVIFHQLALIEKVYNHCIQFISFLTRFNMGLTMRLVISLPIKTTIYSCAGRQELTIKFQYAKLHSSLVTNKQTSLCSSLFAAFESSALYWSTWNKHARLCPYWPNDDK